jgi:hypothetical protein
MRKLGTAIFVLQRSPVAKLHLAKTNVNISMFVAGSL